MSEETLEEEHHCGTKLVRVSADDPANPNDAPTVTCPSCMTVVRIE